MTTSSVRARPGHASASKPSAVRASSVSLRPDRVPRRAGTHSGLADVFGITNKKFMARVGGVHIFHLSDLQRVAPLWLNFTERVRDFACREPERYYELAAPDSNRNDHSDVAKGRRRQFMWMVEM